ncbi:putative transcription factor Hap3/NF-YB family [Medicago truncatula]|uniref:Nucleosome assembly protein n=1 Tax=Medicago truncatula TaxID=3880 RepID=A0A072V1Y0_MEDTR|nr:NAP1-related protein 2 isoform X1 [Medicago truncatula]KEH32130.1 nucleosome assembly protein [Medicago truncatula]RHN63983.1 putative transcription factor Hap3/NF-YB family [Medicago truncatula]
MEQPPMEKKARKKIEWFLFGRQVYSAHKKLNPDLSISIGAVKFAANILNNMLKKLTEEAVKIESNTLDVKEMHAVVNQVFPEKMAKLAHQHGLNAVPKDAKKIRRTKKQKVTRNPKQVDPQLALSIENLQKIQDDLAELNDKKYDQLREIEQKLNETIDPVYIKRDEMIKSIPNFWLNAFLRHPTLKKVMNEEDQKIFKYLSSLDIRAHKDIKSACTTFTLKFNPNPYFEDSKLSKIFTYLLEGTTDHPLRWKVGNITATPIRWKEVKGIPDGTDHEEKGNNRAPVDVRFLSWFCDCEQKDDMAYIDYAVANIFANPLAYLKNEEPDVKDADDEVIEVPFFLEKIKEKDEDDYEEKDDDKGVDEEGN